MISKKIVFIYSLFFCAQALPSWSAINNSRVSVKDRLEQYQTLKAQHKQELELEKEIKELGYAPTYYEPYFATNPVNDRLEILKNCKEEILLKPDILRLDPDTTYFTTLFPEKKFKLLECNRFSFKQASNSYSKPISSLSAKDDRLSALLDIMNYRLLIERYKKLIKIVDACDGKLRSQRQHRVKSYAIQTNNDFLKENISQKDIIDDLRSNSSSYIQFINIVITTYENILKQQ
ncbi:hypothetical protein KBC04_03260 [Candidatus Babeliales bacterium]|nr:hypothetical protein [Candidatus Babeliales bacterium]MBP9843930.1 hypothetical protein [Candidatus Babeliales bacterium]